MSSRWSQLPPELLLSILSKLPAVDVIHSAAVCTTWSTAVDEVRSGHLNFCCSPSPWLLFSRDAEGGVSFYSVLDQKVYTIHPANPPFPNIHRFLNSSRGWLFMVDRCYELLQMFNPITGTCISFPRIRNKDNHRCCKAILSSDPSRRDYTGLPHRCYKAILSSDPSRRDYMVALLHCHGCGFSLFKAGDEKWVAPDEPFHHTPYRDAIFYKGQLYIVSWGCLEVWDVSQPRPMGKRTIPRPAQPLHSYYFDYLVETPWGDLMHVQSVVKCFEPAYAQLFKVDTVVGCQVEVRSREEYMMFLGCRNSAFVLTSKDLLSQIKTNFSSHFISYEGRREEVKTFIWEDDRASGILPGAKSRSLITPVYLPLPEFPIWITPTLP